MQTLGVNNSVNNSQIGVNNSVNNPKSGFWARQFQAQATSKQKIFDWIFGVGLPVICFVFDPIVFKRSGWGTAILGNYKPFAYLLSFVSVMALAAFLIWGKRLKWFNGFLAGLFFFGGFVALCIGVVLLPFSLIGLVILIGALGFTPLFTALVFFRNAFRALQTSRPFLEKSVLVYAVAFGAIFSAVVPWTINSEVRKSFEIIKNGDVQTINAEAEKLKIIAPLVNFDGLADGYYRSWDGDQKTEKSRTLAGIFKEMTGEDIEKKARP